VNRREFLLSSGCACLTAKIGAAAATPAPKVYRCGTPPPTPSEDIQANRVMGALREHRVTFRGKTLIPVRFHIIHVGAQGYLPHRRLIAQVELLNRAYEPSGIAFRIAEARLHENKAWFRHEPGSHAEIAMRLRGLYGLKNTFGKRIVAVGGAGGWGAGGKNAPEIARNQWKMEIVNVPYPVLGERIKR
jgi:hypothetical protein